MKRTIAILLAGIVIGIIGTRYLSKPIITLETQYKDRIITVTKTITKPDGTIEQDTTKTENRTGSSTRAEKLPAWHVSAGAGVHALRFQEPIYKVEVAKDILGPLNVGVWGLSNGTIGLSIGFSF